jgi:hypothetical protein
MKVEFKAVVQVKPYNLGELCNIYGVSPHVMNSWLKPMRNDLGKVYGKLFNIRQVTMIFNEFGAPGLEYYFN